MKNCGCRVRTVKAPDWRDAPSYRIDRKRCLFRDSPTIQVRVKKKAKVKKASLAKVGTKFKVCPYGCDCFE